MSFGEDFLFAVSWKCIPLSLEWFIKHGSLVEKKMLCFCHVVRLCVAEQGADFVTLKYTRKVLWWAAGKKKVVVLQHLRKDHSGLE